MQKSVKITLILLSVLSIICLLLFYFLTGICQGPSCAESRSWLLLGLMIPISFNLALILMCWTGFVSYLHYVAAIYWIMTASLVVYLYTFYRGNGDFSFPMLLMCLITLKVYLALILAKP